MEKYLVDLHDCFMGFKLDVQDAFSSQHPVEVVESTTRLFGYMVEAAVMRSPTPTLKMRYQQDEIEHINRMIAKHYVFVISEVNALELTTIPDKATVDCKIPSSTNITLWKRDVKPTELAIVDCIIEDIAEGKHRYPKHIQDMVENEYQAEINHLRSCD